MQECAIVKANVFFIAYSNLNLCCANFYAKFCPLKKNIKKTNQRQSIKSFFGGLVFLNFFFFYKNLLKNKKTKKNFNRFIVWETPQITYSKKRLSTPYEIVLNLIFLK